MLTFFTERTLHKKKADGLYQTFAIDYPESELYFHFYNDKDAIKIKVELDGKQIDRFTCWTMSIYEKRMQEALERANFEVKGVLQKICLFLSQNTEIAPNLSIVKEPTYYYLTPRYSVTITKDHLLLFRMTDEYIQDTILHIPIKEDVLTAIQSHKDTIFTLSKEAQLFLMEVCQEYYENQ